MLVCALCDEPCGLHALHCPSGLQEAPEKIPRGFRRITGIFVNGYVIVTAAVLFGYRLDTSGYFFLTYLNYRERAKQIITITSNLPRDM